MPKIVFAIIRNDNGNTYDSYTDLWSLVHLSGFETCELDDIDRESDNIYIMSPNNGNVHAAMKVPRKCKCVLWQLERANSIEHAPHLCPPYFDETWVSDRYLHSIIGNPKCRFVIMGGHSGLGREPAPIKLYDFVHISYLYGSREADVIHLERQGYKMAPNGWGQARDHSLAHSKFGLCLHQDAMPIIEPLRYTLFSCWKLPLITAHSHDPHPYEVFDIHHLNISKWQHNYNKLTGPCNFRTCVENAATKIGT